MVRSAVHINERRFLRGAIPDLKIIPAYQVLVSIVVPGNVLVIVIIIFIRIALGIPVFDIHVQNIQYNDGAGRRGYSVNACFIISIKIWIAW